MGVGGGRGGGWVGWKHFLAVTLYNFQRKGAKFPQLLPLGGPCKTKMILFLTTEKQSGWNKKIHEARPCAKTRVAFCASEYEDFFARHVQWTCKPSDLKGQRIGNKLANETTTSCQLVQNFLVCAVETSRLHKLKSFGLIGRHSKLYCLCSRDIQNFIVCAVETFETLLFVQSRHSKIYCLCSRDIRNFIVCAIAIFKTLLFVQSSHSKLFSLRVPSGAPYISYIIKHQINKKQTQANFGENVDFCLRVFAILKLQQNIRTRYCRRFNKNNYMSFDGTWTNFS